MNTRKKNTRSAFCLLLGLLVVGWLGPGAISAEALFPDEVLQIKQVSSVALSHDGKLIAYTLSVPRTADQENGPDWQPLYVRDTEGGPARPFLTGQVNVSSPAFSPDDRYLAFGAKREGDKFTQIWGFPVDGGEARRLTDCPASVASFRWSPDGDRIAYIAPEPPTKRSS